MQPRGEDGRGLAVEEVCGGMWRRVFAALLLIPLVDIIVLIYVATRIGGVLTVAIVVLTALLGLLLVRAEGRHTLRRVARRLAQGELPTNELLDGALLIAAGAFLLTPGLVTDLVGLLLIIPPTRIPIRHALKHWIVIPVLDEKSHGFVTGSVYTAGYPGRDAGETTPIDITTDEYQVDGPATDSKSPGEQDESGKRNP